jgi:hypothetical protein
MDRGRMHLTIGGRGAAIVRMYGNRWKGDDSVENMSRTRYIDIFARYCIHNRINAGVSNTPHAHPLLVNGVGSPVNLLPP